MLQRVMIATALMGSPRLLLADEPTTALDVTTQAEVMAILDELRRERGLAMIFITHDLELAAAVCDRTAVMYAGQIVEVEHVAPHRARPAAPVHRGTAAVSAPHRRDAAPPRCDPGPAAVVVRGAVRRVRVRRPVHARRRRVPQFGTAVGGGRRWGVAVPPARRAARRPAGGRPWLSTCCVVDAPRQGLRLVPGRRRRQLRRRRGAFAGDRRRVGFGQDHDRPDDRRARARHVGDDRRVRHRPQPPAAQHPRATQPRAARCRSCSRTRTRASTRARRCAARSPRSWRCTAPPIPGRRARARRRADAAGRVRRRASPTRCRATSRAGSVSGSRSHGPSRPSLGSSSSTSRSPRSTCRSRRRCSTC